MEKELDIKALRKKLGDISQAQLADAMDVDQSTISNWENGQRPRGPARKLLLSLKPSDFKQEARA